MPLTSDLTFNFSKTDPASVPQQTAAFNEQSRKLTVETPMWWDIGAPKLRQLRWEGKTPLPKPLVLEEGVDTEIPSRDAGRTIPIRYFKPSNGDVKGVFLHIHGGGFVLQSEKYQDPYLKFLADSANLAVVSVGYRLAPEDPFPAGPNDCYDAAEYLVDNGVKQFGGELMFTGGESAGGHLGLCVCLHLLKTRPNFSFKGLVLHFGCFDLSTFLPQCLTIKDPPILTREMMDKYMEAFLPGLTPQQRCDPSISPFYADLTGLKLPPALFTCGSADPVLDDSLMMGIRWLRYGAEGYVKIYPGAAHGFVLFPEPALQQAAEGREDTKEFILTMMAK